LYKSKISDINIKNRGREVSMKIILVKDMDDLGIEGDMVEVSDGYARNYLIPKGFALPATAQNIKMMEMKKRKIETNKIKKKEEALKLKELIEKVTLTIRQRAGEGEKLYGSVTSMNISKALEAEGIKIDKKKIVLQQPIKQLGSYDVPIRLHPEVQAMIKIDVIPE